MKKVKFDIQGMTCSSCVAHLDKAMRKLDGVKNVNVNLLSNNMVLEFDENRVNEDLVIKAVSDTGFGASLTDVDSDFDKNDLKKGKVIDNKNNIANMKKRLIASVCFLIPLMVVAMHQMIFNGLGVEIPHFLKDWFSGNESAISFGFTQFLLLIPILYLNRNYFIAGFKKLFKGSPNMDSLIALRKFSGNYLWHYCFIYDWIWIRSWKIRYS